MRLVAGAQELRHTWYLTFTEDAWRQLFAESKTLKPFRFGLGSYLPLYDSLELARGRLPDTSNNDVIVLKVIMPLSALRSLRSDGMAHRAADRWQVYDVIEVTEYDHGWARLTDVPDNW